MQKSLVDLMLGPALGGGISRTVYLSRFDPTVVIKVENTAEGRFQNVREWLTWQEAEDVPGAQDWLARPLRISDDGAVMFQERTGHFNSSAKPLKAPDRLPCFLSDVKAENYGWVRRGKRILFVAHDYGLNLALYRGMAGLKMRRVRWRE